MNSSTHHKILIVGGGTAGITVAARLTRKISGSDIAIIEPSDKHYYQPLWTLVGGGIFSKGRYSMYLVKKWLLPELYWHGMLRGIA